MLIKLYVLHQVYETAVARVHVLGTKGKAIGVVGK
jgi:hypothetical protein